MLRGFLAVGLLVCGVANAAPEDELEQWRGQTIVEIQLEGNRITREYVIAREIWSEEGQPLDPDTVAQDITRLENLSIFGEVSVTATPAQGGVILNYEFREMPWLLPFPAVSWNEQNGFSVGLGLSSPNFLGHGVNLSTKALFGGTTNYAFRATNPWIAGDHLSADLNAYHNERQNKLLDFEEKSDRVELTMGYYIGRYGRMTGSIGYRGVSSDKDGITIRASNRDDMLATGASVGFDSRDSWRVPRQGWQASVSWNRLAGDAKTHTTSLDVVRYQPVAGSQTLAVGPLLSLQSGDLGTEFPPYEFYFLGGSSSVRGYRIEDLGKEIFGPNRFILNAEYRYLALPVRPFGIFRWSVAVGAELAAFADLGTIWGAGEKFSRDRTRFGYGMGVRLLLPVVEMLRFDMGVSEYGDVMFNFGVRSIFEARSLPIL